MASSMSSSTSSSIAGRNDVFCVPKVAKGGGGLGLLNSVKPLFAGIVPLGSPCDHRGSLEGACLATHYKGFIPT